MTTREARNWQTHTDLSAGRWQIDQTILHNSGVVMAYKGGRNGAFLQIRDDGTIAFGRYEGAIPHIGEATFTVDAVNTDHTTRDAALRWIALEIGTHDFLEALAAVGLAERISIADFLAGK